MYCNAMFSQCKKNAKKIFSIDNANNFSQYFFNRLCPVEKCGVTPHCLYRDSLTLEIGLQPTLNSHCIKILIKCMI